MYETKSNLYSPHPGEDVFPGLRRLTSEIKRCVELYELLTAKGKRFDNKQILTIREVKLIEEYLGEPVYSIEEVLV